MSHLHTWQSSDKTLRVDVWRAGAVPPFYTKYKVAVFDSNTPMGQGIILDDNALVSTFVSNALAEVMLAAATSVTGDSTRLVTAARARPLRKTDNRLQELLAHIKEVEA